MKKVFILLAIFSIALLACQPSKPATPPPAPTPVVVKPDTPESRDPSTVFYASKMFMEKELKAPKSAQWPEYGDEGIKVGFSQKTGKWVVASFVDSQNSYGALIRTLYVMVIEYLPGQGYRMVTLDTQP
jgi:hypothetical protein